MSCPTPDIRVLISPVVAYALHRQSKAQRHRVVRNAGQDSPFTLSQSQFGFILDGVKNFTSLENVPGIQAFKFYPDPMYYKFTEADNIKKLKFDQNNIFLEIQVCLHCPRPFCMWYNGVCCLYNSRNVIFFPWFLILFFYASIIQ